MESNNLMLKPIIFNLKGQFYKELFRNTYKKQVIHKARKAI
jgi:hypothetical protein